MVAVQVYEMQNGVGERARSKKRHKRRLVKGKGVNPVLRKGFP